jgi:aminopeptidase N
MKKTIRILIFLVFASGSAQKQLTELDQIAESERKSATKTLNFVANANTQNYDVTYHKLEFNVNPAVYFISGTVTTTFKALANMTSITFDLANELTVNSVTRNGVSLTFVQNANEELVINFPTSIPINTLATVVITYSGPPSTGESAFTVSNHGSPSVPVLYTLSEPFGARDWWPCKQDLNDKIDSLDVFITAPSQYTSVSNGLEMSAIGNLIGGKTTHFKHNYPIPAYLVAIAVTNYSVFTQTAGTAPFHFPIVNYLYPESLNANLSNLASTLPIMNFFEQTFERYPFYTEKYGHAQFGWGGGMEHTTVSFMNNFSRGLIAHELAHQWFGDKITCGSWNDIWLNEGFATYLSSMVIEHLDGPAAFVTDKTNMINSITSQTNGAVYLSDLEATSVNRIFSSRLSYNKGAMVLNMLRWKMGNTMFIQALKNYLADTNLAYKYAVTAQFKSHLEAVYGSSLTEFFNDWVFGQGYPTYTINIQNFDNWQAKFTINQTQSHSSVSFFEMPLPIRVFGSGGQQMDLVLEHTANGQEFTRPVPFTITNVVFDPNKNIISKSNLVSLGTENFELSNLKLYPNPAKTVLNLDIDKNTIVSKTTIHNALGQKIVATTNATLWNVSTFSKGLYFVEIETNFGKTIRKFLIE